MWLPTGMEITEDPVHKNFLRAAYEFAWEYSDDKHTKNGSVLVNEYGMIISYGANRFPPGIEKTPQRLERPEKYAFIQHAERDAIYGAAKLGMSTYGTRLYCVWSACIECGKAIQGAGIERLVTHKAIMEKTPEGKWRQEIQFAIDRLVEKGVEVLTYDGKIGDVKALYNTEVWEP